MEYKKNYFRQYFAVDGLEVSSTGQVRRTYKDIRTITGKSIYPHKLSWQTDKEGNVIVRTKDHGDLRVDKLVATCFWGRPRDGKVYLIHKDKDKMNCSKDNLQWVTQEEFYQHYSDDPIINSDDGFRQVSYGLYVSKNGEVRETRNGELMKVHDAMYDADTDSWAPIDPHVGVYISTSYNAKRVSIDGLVAEAYLPKPRSEGYLGLLHKDNNYKNCSLDNLEWVDISSDEYEKYMEQRKKDTDERFAELNPGKRRP